jgi:hypothetical protein
LQDEIGRLGEYRVLQLLGQGAMGMVFRAEDPGLTRILALKVMLPAVAAMPENRERFLREARATALVNHPNVIPIYKIGEDRGVPFLAMPLLKGELLEARLNRERRLSIPDAVRIAKEIAEGLAAAHERNLIHRDIKPANLWLEAVQRRNATDRVKILDFGLARLGDAGLTTPGAVLGTPAYMAPEQAKGIPVDYRCDLFSLGSVMYRMLTGERAFQGNEIFAVLMALTTVHPIPPHEVNPEVPVPLSQLVMHLLAKDPDERPQSGTEVVNTLSRLGYISGTSSTDKMPIYGAGSSGNLPLLPPANGGGAKVTPRPTASATGSEASGTRSLLVGIGVAVVAVLCLVVILARGFFGAATMSTVKLELSPADATVIVDNKETQLDPFNPVLKLTPGRHDVKVRHQGYHGQSLILELVAGENQPIVIPLKKLPDPEPVKAPPQAVPGKTDGERIEEKKPEQKREPEQIKEPEQKPPGKTAELPDEPKPPEKKPNVPPEVPPLPPAKLPPRTEEKSPNTDNSAAKLPPAKEPEKEPEKKPQPPVKNPFIEKKDPPESTPVRVIKPQPRAVDRDVAEWVLERGGTVTVQQPRKATSDAIHQAAKLPGAAFELRGIKFKKGEALEDASLAKLEGLRQLTVLDLSGTRVTDEQIGLLRNFRVLTDLILHDTGITDKAIPNLKLLKGLRNLDLEHTKITDEGLRDLRLSMPALQVTEP